METTGLTPEELRQIRRLHVQAGRRVDSLLAGDYRSAFRGTGMEFDEVRPYVPGDDVRRIDWNVTARQDAPFLKTFKEERELTLLLVMDVSASLRYGGGGKDGLTDKRLQLARAAGGLAYAALRTGDRVGLVTFTDRVEHYLPPRRSRGHAWAVIRAAFEHGPHAGQTNVAAALGFVSKVLRRRAVVVVLSDFVSPRPFRAELGALARRHKVHALLVHDPSEHALPSVGLLALRDAESGRVVTVDARAFSALPSPDRRVAELRSQGAHSSALSTREDAFLLLQRHFRTQR